MDCVLEPYTATKKLKKNDILFFFGKESVRLSFTSLFLSS